MDKLLKIGHIELVYNVNYKRSNSSEWEKRKIYFKNISFCVTFKAPLKNELGSNFFQNIKDIFSTHKMNCIKYLTKILLN